MDDLSNATWRKARRSAENGGACVELASICDAVAIRDSKDPDGPKILLSHDDFRRLAETIKNA